MPHIFGMKPVSVDPAAVNIQWSGQDKEILSLTFFRSMKRSADIIHPLPDRKLPGIRLDEGHLHYLNPVIPVTEPASPWLINKGIRGLLKKCGITDGISEKTVLIGFHGCIIDPVFQLLGERPRVTALRQERHCRQ